MLPFTPIHVLHDDTKSISHQCFGHLPFKPPLLRSVNSQSIHRNNFVQVTLNPLSLQMLKIVRQISTRTIVFIPTRRCYLSKLLESTIQTFQEEENLELASVRHLAFTVNLSNATAECRFAVFCVLSAFLQWNFGWSHTHWWCFGQTAVLLEEMQSLQNEFFLFLLFILKVVIMVLFQHRNLRKNFQLILRQKTPKSSIFVLYQKGYMGVNPPGNIHCDQNGIKGQQHCRLGTHSLVTETGCWFENIPLHLSSGAKQRRVTLPAPGMTSQKGHKRKIHSLRRNPIVAISVMSLEVKTGNFSAKKLWCFKMRSLSCRQTTLQSDVQLSPNLQKWLQAELISDTCKHGANMFTSST